MKRRYPFKQFDETRYFLVTPKLCLKLEWRQDDDADLSWLGDSVRDEPYDWYADRRKGIVYGPMLHGELPVYLPVEGQSLDDLYEQLEEEGWRTIEEYYEYSDDPEEDSYDDGEHVGWIVDGPIPLCTGFEQNIVHEGYFKFGENHIPHNPESWQSAYIPDELRQKTIDEYGSFEMADIAYAVADWQYYEEHMSGERWMNGIIATFYKLDIPFQEGTERYEWEERSESSLWGIDCEFNSAEEYAYYVAAEIYGAWDDEEYGPYPNKGKTDLEVLAWLEGLEEIEEWEFEDYDEENLPEEEDNDC